LPLKKKLNLGPVFFSKTELETENGCAQLGVLYLIASSLGAWFTKPHVSTSPKKRGQLAGWPGGASQ
jgi:hypothetical protein